MGSSDEEMARLPLDSDPEWSEALTYLRGVREEAATYQHTYISSDDDQPLDPAVAEFEDLRRKIAESYEPESYYYGPNTQDWLEFFAVQTPKVEHIVRLCQS